MNGKLRGPLSRFLTVSAVVGAVLALATATADARPNRVGLRGGVTDDADTGFLGLFLVTGHRAGLRIAPSADIGFGDREAFDVFTIRGTGNVEYAMPLGRSSYIFPIVGVSVIYTNFSDCAGDCDEIDAGVNVGLGLEANRVRFELTAGIGDIPDLTLALGFTF